MRLLTEWLVLGRVLGARMRTRFWHARSTDAEASCPATEATEATDTSVEGLPGWSVDPQHGRAWCSPMRRVKARYGAAWAGMSLEAKKAAGDELIEDQLQKIASKAKSIEDLKKLEDLKNSLAL